MSQSRLPRVSVVMAVYNSPELLERTINSVLTQAGVELEFIVIDDGSNAATQAILRSISDSRVVLHRQENLGLTQALIKACKLATSRYIARIDVGDQMLPNRLSIQAKVLADDDSVALVCSPVSLKTIEGFHLMDVNYSQQALQEGLTQPCSGKGATPFHASVMFRLKTYRHVGGYRKEFYFAQDLDLWSRLVEQGRVVTTEQVLTNGVFLPSSLSARYAKQQSQLRKIVDALISARQNNADESALLSQAHLIRLKRPNKEIVNEFSGNYFIGKCLLKTHRRGAQKYLLHALRANRLSLKTWWALLQSLMVGEAKRSG